MLYGTVLAVILRASDVESSLNTISEQTVCPIFLKSVAKSSLQDIIEFLENRLSGSVVCICPSIQLELGWADTSNVVRCGVLDNENS